MLKPKLSDDPHDILMVAPDAVRVAPVDAAPARPAPEPLIPAGSIFSAGTAVPSVDAAFRPTAVNDVLAPDGPSIGGRALRAFTAVLLTACIGGAAVAWQSHGDAVQALIAEWAPLFARTSSPPSEKTGLPAQPTLAAAEVDAVNASASQPAVVAQTTAGVAAPPPDEAPSLETMARDLANAGQEIAALKASIEQLKASQQQLVAMVSEKAPAQALRPRKPVQPPPPPRPVAALAPARKPPSLSPPALPPRQAIAAPPLPPAPAPYVPRQAEPSPPTAAETLADPELPSVPRPPMPLR
jgi:hypothetical protein